MITLEQAKKLKIGDTVYQISTKTSVRKKWKVIENPEIRGENGRKIKISIYREPNAQYGYITENNLDKISLNYRDI